jgi:tRNA-dihydrouridine synthase
MAQRVMVAKKHITLATEWNGDIVGVLETRRHYANYFKGIPNFKEYRMKLVTAATKEEVLRILEDVLNNFE